MLKQLLGHLSGFNLEGKAHYRADLEGLRGLAVLAVIIFHAKLPLPGGFTGVDIFFVLSGFLITSTLLNEIQRDGRICLSKFWARRVRRILPAAVWMSSIVLVYAAVTQGPLAHLRLYDEAFYQSVFISNLYYAENLTAYGVVADFYYYFLHTWSLSIEEQFYLVFPIVIVGSILVLRKCRSKQNKLFSRLALVLGAITLGSFILSSMQVLHEVEQTGKGMADSFFYLHFRAWELLAGAIVACLMLGPQNHKFSIQGKFRGLCSLVGLSLIIAPFFLLGHDSAFPAYGALPTVLGTSILLWTSGSYVNQLLSILPFRYAGKLSYSLYLWHWPVFVALKQYNLDDLNTAGIIFGITISWLLSEISYRFIESPFRRRAVVRPSVWLLGGAIAILSFLGLKTAVQSTGLHDEMPTHLKQLLMDADWGLPEHNDADAVGIKCLGLNPKLQKPPKGKAATFAVLGDSHAYALGHALDRYIRELHTQGALTEDYYGVALPYSGIKAVPGFNAARHRFNWPERVASSRALTDRLIQTKSIRQLFIAHRYDSIYHADELGHPPEVSMSAYIKEFESLMEQWIIELGDAGIDVYLLNQVPLSNIPIYAALYGRATLSGWGKRTQYKDNYSSQIEYHNPSRAFLQRLATTHDHVTLLDPFTMAYTEQSRLKLHDGTRAFYKDADHLTGYGAEQIILPLLRQEVNALDLID